MLSLSYVAVEVSFPLTHTRLGFFYDEELFSLRVASLYVLWDKTLLDKRPELKETSVALIPDFIIRNMSFRASYGRTSNIYRRGTNYQSFKNFNVVWQLADEENQNVSSGWSCMLELLFCFCYVCHKKCANMNVTDYHIVRDEEKKF
jgi:hypothetical protein